MTYGSNLAGGDDVLGACQQVRVEGAIVRLQVPLGAA